MYVTLKNINKKYGDYKAAEDINLNIEKGKLIALLGPSGSGKTTILRMIAGLENPDLGEIYIDDVKVNNIHPSKRGIGFVFQNYALFKYMNVYDNIAFGLRVQKKSNIYIKERVEELLELVNLKGLEKRYPNELSGGQKQRVAFARALAPKPKLLLLDEPFAAVDAKVRYELRNWLKKMIKEVSITSIFVTHDQEEAIEVADEIIISNKGKIEQKGTALEIYKNPSTEFVADFIGKSNILDKYTHLKGFNHLEEGKKTIIRPEFIKIIRSEDKYDYSFEGEIGIIEEVSFRGNYIEVQVRIKNIVLTTIRRVDDEILQIGEIVKVIIYCLYFFNKEKGELIQNSNLESNYAMYI